MNSDSDCGGNIDSKSKKVEISFGDAFYISLKTIYCYELHISQFQKQPFVNVKKGEKL